MHETQNGLTLLYCFNSEDSLIPDQLDQMAGVVWIQNVSNSFVHVFINSELKLNLISQVQDFSKTDLGLRGLGDWVISLYVDK